MIPRDMCGFNVTINVSGGNYNAFIADHLKNGILYLIFNNKQNKIATTSNENITTNKEMSAEEIVNALKENDLVILPGDFSWAMRSEDTQKDFEYLNNLPGKKILLKGNHDYWWTTLNKMRKFIKEN